MNAMEQNSEGTDSKNEIISILERACDLLEKKGWIQGVRAKNVSGYSCDPKSKEAVQFCLVGALDRAILDETGWYTQEIFEDVVTAVGNYLLSDWNVYDQVFGTIYYEVAHYNDYEAESVDDILRILRSTICLENLKEM